MPKPIIRVIEGDIVQLRKPHPCGADTWTVIRVGSDMVLENTDCDRRVTLTRSKFNKAVKRVLPRPGQNPE
ncbi:MAG: DUF951 domain-containing protein [Chloroflexota bacterium]